ncbi:MAG: hypothetical protein PHU85_02345 [Phycisphaerae bacterium]|nr:hypothetical protein [Phycisphaerae bacterium]
MSSGQEHSEALGDAVVQAIRDSRPIGNIDTLVSRGHIECGRLDTLVEEIAVADYRQQAHSRIESLSLVLSAIRLAWRQDAAS